VRCELPLHGASALELVAWSDDPEAHGVGVSAADPSMDDVVLVVLATCCPREDKDVHGREEPLGAAFPWLHLPSGNRKGLLAWRCSISEPVLESYQTSP